MTFYCWCNYNRCDDVVIIDLFVDVVSWFSDVMAAAADGAIA